MQLTLWTYEGPPHVGAMRVATALQDAIKQDSGKK